MADATGIRDRVGRGFALMSGRLALTYVLRLASVLLLARFLLPADYAVFGAVSTLVGLVQFGADLGLSGALVQRREEPDEQIIAAVFWTKLGLALVLAGAVWVGAAPLVRAAGYGEAGAWLLRVYVLQLPIETLRTIPAAQLDRRLAFDRSVVAEVVDLVTLYAVQIALAAAGAHAWSLVAAGVARAVAGTAVYSALNPWRLPGSWTPRRLAELMRFGIPFHGATLVHALRAMIPAWVIARYAGAQQAGLAVWALGIAGMGWPLAQLVDRLMFPAFARAADSPLGRRDAARALLVAGAVGSVALLCLLGPAAPPLVRLVFGERWIEAAALLPLAAGLTACAMVSYLTSAILNGTGRPAWRFGIGVVATAAELGCALWLVPRFGAVGYFVPALAVALAEVAASLAGVSAAVAAVVWRPLMAIVAGFAAVGLGAAAGGAGAAPPLRLALGIATAALAAGAMLAALLWADLGAIRREVGRQWTMFRSRAAATG